MRRDAKHNRAGFNKAVAIIRAVCVHAGSPDLIDDALVYLAGADVTHAIAAHDDAILFNWLMRSLSYQGISDAAADSYMAKHGTISYRDVNRPLSQKPDCPKLASYWHFRECGFRKGQRRCNEPSKLSRCPLPKHDLRNGNLNQAAYSLFLFMRDVAGGDFVAWTDRQLADADFGSRRTRPQRFAASLIQPLRQVYGISDKVLSMTLSMLLLTGDPSRERWVTAGTGMIAVDTLVHNWLHRTGILNLLGAPHPYGIKCHGEHGCAAIIRRASSRIDASAFNSAYPKNFPRFVQHAVWRFCSQSGLDECNGNRIDDTKRCARKECVLRLRCARVPLHEETTV